MFENTDDKSQCWEYIPSRKDWINGKKYMFVINSLYFFDVTLLNCEAVWTCLGEKYFSQQNGKYKSSLTRM
jgi:hypothetical protein